MKQTPFRAPAYPLFTTDPYTSIWSMGDRLNGDHTRHWTGKPNALIGLAVIDGAETCFMGHAAELGVKPMEQTAVYFDAFFTIYTFRGEGVELRAAFTSPLIPDDLMLLSRPVSYLRLSVRSLDGAAHEVQVTVKATSQLCLERMRVPVTVEERAMPEGFSAIRMGGIEQPILGKAGDDLRIDWGYVYLAAPVPGKVFAGIDGKQDFIAASAPLHTTSLPETLFFFGYDDLYSITYFGKPLKAYWKKDGLTMEEALYAAFQDAELTAERCRAFDAVMAEDARRCGGEQYADLLKLALRQVLAAHKLVLDENGDILYISKECFSNGCAATVDVSYPSIPLFLLYNHELVRGMMRPIMKYAAGPVWPFDFAPHDVGTYPILNGQVYSEGVQPHAQMPVEECGNMLVMAAADAAVSGDGSFALQHRALLKTWAEYLRAHGIDPENQLCTDDFAGHLAHNCNLSLKAIMGLMGFSTLCRLWGETAEADDYRRAAQSMAAAWLAGARNEDGSYRLAFDQPGTFSMKYNAVWDRLFDTGLFPREAIAAELESYSGKTNPYGLPLDNRADYTKSDWLVWTATLAETKEQFMAMIAPLHLCYSKSPSRVPMTDWYSTVTSLQIGFQHRTVQGGLWIKLLADKGLCRIGDTSH